jgi:hypothetical protein
MQRGAGKSRSAARVREHAPASPKVTEGRRRVRTVGRERGALGQRRTLRGDEPTKEASARFPTPDSHPRAAVARAEVRGSNNARELMEQNLNLAMRPGDSNMLVQAYHGLGYLQTWAGDLASARASQEQLLALYDSKTHHPLARLFGDD